MPAATMTVVTFLLSAAQFGQRRMTTITELNDENFERNIVAANLPVVVDVYAPWCGPCKMIAPLLDKLAEHYAGRLQFFKVNVDEAQEIAARYEITGVPTLLLINQAGVQDVIVGFPGPQELLAKMEALAASSQVTAATEARP
jgi:thioredoxin 1